LNRSRLELLARAGEASKRVTVCCCLIFAITGKAIGHTPRWVILESQDVGRGKPLCSPEGTGSTAIAMGCLHGAATALLAVRDYGGFAGVVSDSSFRRFARRSNTRAAAVSYTVVPIANLIVWITGKDAYGSGLRRCGRRGSENLAMCRCCLLRAEPIGACRREWQNGFNDANQSPLKQLIVVPGAVMAKRLRRIGRDT